MNGEYQGFVWRGGSFEAFKVPNASYTTATGINSRGDVVGEYMRDGKAYGYIWNGKNFNTIDVSESPDTLSWCSALGVNANRDIVGWYGSGETWIFHAYALINGILTTIDGPGSSWTIAHGINARGDVVGWYYDSNFNLRGFVWRGDNLETIDIPDAVGTLCEGINDQGDIVGWYIDANGIPHGFLMNKQK